MTSADAWSVADWQEKLEQLQPSKIELGLDRVSAIADRLGLLQANALASQVIIIGGTNGKGSTVRLLEQLLINNGARVGAYTSPHLCRFNERIRIAGQMVCDEALCEAFASVEAARGDITLTYFEFTTLAAMHLFHQDQLDIALLEVGLGGRLDAVNIIDADLAVITSIGLDHQEWLGDTRASIAAEKAGIMRTGKPVLSGDPNPPETLIQHAHAVQASLMIVGSAFGAETHDDGRWAFWSNTGGVRLNGLLMPQLPLTSAVLALQCLHSLGVHVPVSTVNKTLSECALMGRFQKVSTLNSTGTSIHYILDVAHNPQAIEFLVERIRHQCVQGQYKGGRLIAICAILSDKDADSITKLMATLVDEWVLPHISAERARAPSSLCLAVKQHSAVPVKTMVNMREAIAHATETAGVNDLVLVFGSFYTVAEGLEILEGANSSG